MTTVERIDPEILPHSEEKSLKSIFAGYSTFYGVYLPGALSLFGVILYLRLGSILGNIGLFQMIIIIAMSSLITLLTGLSISATATNMKIKSGGVYYLISRSFGVEIGSAIGIALYFAQVVGIAFFIEGLSESVSYLFPIHNPILLEAVALSIIMAITYISSAIALKAQFYILLIIGFSILSFFLGHSYEFEPTLVNFAPPISFWAAFAMFFPAVTGIEASFSISGELKDPTRSLPKGTLLVVLTGLLSYLIIVFFMWNTLPAETLKSDPMAFFHISRLQSLAFLGVWAATISCIIGSFISAPRTLQALANDHVIPSFFGRGYGASNQPKIATLVTYAITLVFIYFGDINILAPILSMFFLISYGMLNLTAGLEGLFGNPSWRPSFSTPASLSLVGACFCLLAMLMIDSGATILAIATVVLFYLITKTNKLGGGWEDIRQGCLLFFCRFAIYKLSVLGPSVRSWRPYFLVFSSSPTQITHVIDFAHSITKDKGFLTISSIITTPEIDNNKIIDLENITKDFLQKRKIHSLIQLEKAEDYYTGVKKMISTYGLGPITPNTIVFGYSFSTNSSFDREAEIMFHAHELQKNVIILKDQSEDIEKTIDIWWDEESKMNSELMIVLGHMLSNTPRWNKCEVNLKCIVKNEYGREQRMKYFEEFFARSRLNINVQVLVVPESDSIELRTMSTFSSNSSLAMVGMCQPVLGEKTEDYSAYMKELMSGAKFFKNIAFVMCAEKIQLNKMFDNMSV